MADDKEVVHSTKLDDIVNESTLPDNEPQVSLNDVVGDGNEPRTTKSSENDSSFDGTVSLVSSSSSASSFTSSSNRSTRSRQRHVSEKDQQSDSHDMQEELSDAWSDMKDGAKVQLSLHSPSTYRKLIVTAYTSDGTAKSLVVDERMTCEYVARLFAGMFKVEMQPNYSLVEILSKQQMERLFENHELLLYNLMNWYSDAGNRLLFQQRTDKMALFAIPELFLPGPPVPPGTQHNKHTRRLLLTEFFNTNSELDVDGPLYMKLDPKAPWERYHFVLRSAAIYYSPESTSPNSRELSCLALLNAYNVYRGLSWKQKWKSPTDYTFALNPVTESTMSKEARSLKMFCAEDLETLEKWITALRIAKYGKEMWEHHKALNKEYQVETHNLTKRTNSMSSIPSSIQSESGCSISMSATSCTSFVSSNGCITDYNSTTISTSTVKRFPCKTPSLPLTKRTKHLRDTGDSHKSDSNDNRSMLGCLHKRSASEQSNTSADTLKQIRKSMDLSIDQSIDQFSVELDSKSLDSTPTPSICGQLMLPATCEAIPSLVEEDTKVKSSAMSFPSNIIFFRSLKKIYNKLKKF